MQNLASRVRPGPFERFAVEDTSVYPNGATADLALDTIARFRRARAAQRHDEFPVLPIEVGDMRGRLVLAMYQPMVSHILGYRTGATATSVRLEFDRFTIIEGQKRLGRGKVERRLTLGTDQDLPETTAVAMVGQFVSALMRLPEELADLFGERTIVGSADRGAGRAFDFDVSKWG